MKKKLGIFAIFLMVSLVMVKMPLEAKGTTYSVKYVLEQGINSKKNPVKVKADANKKLYNAKKTGYTFAGWYTDKKYKKQIKKISGITKNITLYAKWKINKYNIVYEKNGGEASKTVIVKNISYLKNYKIRKNTYTAQAGYKFAGWNTKKDGSGITFQSGDSVKQLTDKNGKSVKLYAIWTPKKYSIVYNLNLGINNKENPTYYTIEDEVNLKVPTKQGFSFMGWYLDKEYNNKVTRIEKGSTGTVKLYAKWEQEGINVNLLGTDDMIWSWWYYPQAITTNDDDLYYTFNTSQGYTGVAHYNALTKVTDKTLLKQSLTSDDHNGASIIELSDGRIMCAYAGGHNNDKEIHIRISDEANSIKSFNTAVTIEASGVTSYSQLFSYENTYFLFYRVSNTTWVYRTSTDGLEWSDEIVFVEAPVQYYIKMVPTTSDGMLRVCMTSNPAAGQCDIRMGFFSLDSRVIYNGNATTPLGYRDIYYDEFWILINCPAGYCQRLFDVAVTDVDQTQILYAVYTAASRVDSVYNIYDNGKIVEVCKGGLQLKTKYQLGASFVNQSKIVVARGVNDSDTIELYDYLDGKVVLDKTVYTEDRGSDSIRNARPVADINGKAILWHRGQYDPVQYTSFKTEAKCYFIDRE